MGSKVRSTLVFVLLLLVCGFGVVSCVAEHPRASAGVVGVLVAVLVTAAVASHVADRRKRARFAAGGNHAVAARVARGAGLGIDVLAQRLDTTADALRAVRPGYREVQIPKRSGGGTRTLHVPDDRTKSLQRAVLRRVLHGLRAHPAATGFERGRSIVDNARPHVGREVVIRMDVVDFFPSTSEARVLRYFQWIGWDAEAAAALARLTTWQGGLPQGAPTSPRLSNLVNRYLDVQIALGIARRGGVYTRYADDITVSLDDDRGRRVRGAIQHVRRVLRRHGYRLHTRRKLHVARRHERQVVTGLVVNGTRAGEPAAAPRLPREVRRRLRATMHRLGRGLDPTQGVDEAAGWIAYARMVRAQAAPRPEPPAA